MKLRTKLLLLLMPLVMAPLLFLGNLSYTQLRDSAEARLFDEVASAMTAHQLRMDAKVDTAAANVHVLANSIVVKSLLQDRDNAQLEAFDHVLTAYQETYSDHYDVFIIDSRGEELIRHSGPKAAATGEMPASIRSRLLSSDAPIVADTVLDTDSDFVSLLFAEPITGDAGERLGTFALSVAVDNLNRGARSIGIGDAGYYLVTNARGDVLFGHSERAIRSLPDSAGFADWARAVGSEDLVELDIGGVDAFVSGTRLADDLYLFAIIPASQLDAASQSIGLIFLLVTAVAIVLTTGALFLGLHHMVLRPIEQIRAAFHQIGRGEFEVRLDDSSSDEIGELATAFHDMNERLRESNDHVQYLAYHDSLTGLPNRTLFRDQLTRAMAQAERDGQKLAILFIDLDDFKRVNDTLGHQVGDKILRRVSETLTEELRAGDLVSRINAQASDHMIARLGGDEFIILLRNVEDDYAPRSVARRLCKLLRQPFIVEENELFVSSSIGISMFPGDSKSADDLIKNADAAMYHAKERGKNNYQYYSESMNEAVAHRLLMETKLRKALELNQFELYYQPKVDPLTYSIIGAEALIRWNDPDTGLVSPNDFISIAEDSGLIVPIGEWVLNQACIQLKEWQSRKLPPISVAVNVSAIQVARQDISFIVSRSLKNSGVKARYLDVEITESALMAGGQRTTNMLSELRELDVAVSLDDFGTGYSSLSYLRKFPISNLKIDQSFFAEIESDESSRSIVAAIIAMSKTLNMTVTAEGVETEAQMEFLRTHGCDFAQGFLISPPVPAAEFESLLRDTDGYARKSAVASR